MLPAIEAAGDGIPFATGSLLGNGGTSAGIVTVHITVPYVSPHIFVLFIFLVGRRYDGGFPL